MVDIETLVPAGPLEGFLDRALPDTRGAPVRIRKIGAGRSNLTFEVRRGDRRMVLRRPPMGDLPQTAHDMMREHRVLDALAESSVRAPRPLVACADESIIGVPFYLMEQVDGEVIRERIPSSFDTAARTRIGHEMVDALAELHLCDYHAVGLGDFGKPEGYTARQVKRWAGQWEVMATREIDDIEEVREWLHANVPTDSPHSIVHGDYRLDNVVFAGPPDVRLVSILDWEMSTLGDPLADLGYLLLFWPEAGERQIAGLEQPTSEPGFSTRSELLDRYERATGFDVGNVSFYRTLAMWKLAILTEGLYKRYLAGKADSDWFAILETAVPEMAATARSWCG